MKTIAHKTISALILAMGMSMGVSAANAQDSAGYYFAQERRIRVAALEDLSRPQRAIPQATRSLVADPTGQGAGTITVDTKNRYLYLSLGNGQAVRYGVGVGRAGFEWSGTAQIGRKAEWPAWTPPPAMLKRRPDLPRHMEGGIDNPLGARALYLHNGGKDTLFRIHGTNEPDTIGQAVSSGCIRMMNDDVTDLYNRVRIGTKVRVI
jgi:lipoprotein-anchoring transpeptidase ErfK/SrfK